MRTRVVFGARFSLCVKKFCRARRGRTVRAARAFLCGARPARDGAARVSTRHANLLQVNENKRYFVLMRDMRGRKANARAAPTKVMDDSCDRAGVRNCGRAEKASLAQVFAR